MSTSVSTSMSAMQAIPLILFTVLTNAAAQILLKNGMIALGPIEQGSRSLIGTVLSVLFQPYVFAGLCVFVISMASHLYVLSKVELSFAYPFLSIAYVVVLAYAYFVFNENVGATRMAGVLLICCGTVLVARS